MSFKYNLEFHPKALKEFQKLGAPVRAQFKAKLEKVLEDPHIPSAALRGGLKGAYKIKLRSSGHRLVYQVFDNRVVVLVLAVARREKNEAYERASARAD